MKVIVEERGSLTRQHLANRVNEILDLIRELPDRERAERLQVLAKILLSDSSVSHFFSTDNGKILSWLGSILAFIEERGKPVAVHIGPFDSDGRCFAMTNSSDAAHLLDSLQSYLQGHGHRFHVMAHPILTIRRQRGRIVQFAEINEPGPKESFILLELEKGLQDQCPCLEPEIEDILMAALRAQKDQKKLLAALRNVERVCEDSQASEFIGWLRRGNFLPFAYRCLRVQEDGHQWRFSKEGPDLGISLKEAPAFDAEQGTLDDFDPVLADNLLRTPPLVVESTDLLSPVHRREPLHYLGFRERLNETEFVEHAFWGLFSLNSINEPLRDLPVLFRKVQRALKLLHIPDDCYDFRKTEEVFTTFPRVELFFMGEEEIAETIRSFLALQRRGAVKVVVTRSLSLHGLTLLVIMPKEFYTPENLRRVEGYLCRRLKAPGAESRIIHIYSDYISIHVALRPAGEEVLVDIDSLETALTDLVRPWDSRLRRLLNRLFGKAKASALWHRYGEGFPEEYRAFSHPRYALRDFLSLERLREKGRDHFDLWGPFKGEQGAFYRLQFYSYRESNLNELMPILENLNLVVSEEVDFPVNIPEGQVAYIKSFTLRAPEEGRLPLSDLKARLIEALDAIWSGECENDYLNRLLVLTGLNWKEIDIYRGYRNYYFQLGTPFTKKRVAYALIHNPRIATVLIRYFESRFKPEKRWEDPTVREEEALSPLRMELLEALEQVNDINEDRILRGLFNLIDSTVRTNFFKRVDSDDYFLSFKISAIGIMEMAFPRPLYETYVHSATMEGIHLRGGKVARGGIRWSDRPDDFRTEVLGLMKTQMTKNTLIVPVGSKGGFVVKTPYVTREEGAQLSKAAYQTLMRGLLDLTDNRLSGEIIRPEGIVAYDDADPYLVVAADKGTAHLSDTANEISAEYGFWLGDAFASGGSKGYDHKKLGITARGAWESVKRHFRELGHDVQAKPFTVIGIGDMSGDVFGNGMLLSDQIRLLAAFDHRHIFLDPDPDPAVSFAERQRLFSLQRSSWEDYNPGLISSGGGVWPRSSKDIPLSESVREWLGVRHQSMDGEDLVRAILAAKADLLWNGGIGTYVKASSEKNSEVGDRANDAVRIDANQVNVAVVGEGGNLGFTQRARVEFALNGGHINTDAVDNSGGVDSSDHEVNLKILMRQLIESAKVASPDERDVLLGEVTEEVCRDVLANNYTQSLELSLDLQRCRINAESFLELTDRLINAGLLDRQSEFLPTRKELLSRKEQTFTRPELAILLAYAKMQLYQDLLESDLPDQECLRRLLSSYFPDSIRKRFAEDILTHPLARELTATMATNYVIDRAGSAFFHSLSQETGRSWVDGVRAYLLFDQVIGGEEIRQGIFALDNRMSSVSQYEALDRLEQALASMLLWALEHDCLLDATSEAIASYKEKVDIYQKSLAETVPEEKWKDCRQLCSELVEQGAAEELASRISILGFLDDFLPLVEISDATDKDLRSVAKALELLRESFAAPTFLAYLDQVPLRDHWDRMTRREIEEELTTSILEMTRALLVDQDGNIDAFLAQRKQKFRYYKRLQEQVLGRAPVNFHPALALVSSLQRLTEA